MGLHEKLKRLRGKLARAAQAVVDDWDVDEDGISEVFGSGGPCDEIAKEMAYILSEAGIDTIDGGQPGDDHAWLIAFDAERRQAFGVDVPPSVYETGGGYSWKKIEGAQVSPRDVAVFPIPFEDIEEVVADLEEAVAVIGRRKIRLSGRQLRAVRGAYSAAARRMRVYEARWQSRAVVDGLSSGQLPRASVGARSSTGQSAAMIHELLEDLSYLIESDARIRRLERAARTGGPDDIVRLHQEMFRAGLQDPALPILQRLVELADGDELNRVRSWMMDMRSGRTPLHRVKGGRSRLDDDRMRNYIGRLEGSLRVGKIRWPAASLIDEMRDGAWSKAKLLEQVVTSIEKFLKPFAWLDKNLEGHEEDRERVVNQLRRVRSELAPVATARRSTDLRKTAAGERDAPISEVMDRAVSNFRSTLSSAYRMRVLGPRSWRRVKKGSDGSRTYQVIYTAAGAYDRAPGPQDGVVALTATVGEDRVVNVTIRPVVWGEWLDTRLWLDSEELVDALRDAMARNYADNVDDYTFTVDGVIVRPEVENYYMKVISSLPMWRR